MAPSVGVPYEREVVHHALECIRKGTPQMRRHDLLHQHGMCCGGGVEVYIEPVKKKNKLYIFGAGHTGAALARLARAVDLDVYLADDRREYLDAVQHDGINLLPGSHTDLLPLLPFDTRSYIAIMTYSHPMDHEILAFCLKKPLAYLGMIGSQRKVELTRKMFLEGQYARRKNWHEPTCPWGWTSVPKARRRSP